MHAGVRMSGWHACAAGVSFPPAAWTLHISVLEAYAGRRAPRRRTVHAHPLCALFWLLCYRVGSRALSDSNSDS